MHTIKTGVYSFLNKEIQGSKNPYGYSFLQTQYKIKWYNERRDALYERRIKKITDGNLLSHLLPQTRKKREL
jgi:hypothetical protein